MSWFESIAINLLVHPFLLSFISATVLGEEAIIFLSFLAGENLIHLWIVLIFGVLGLITFDNLLYFIIKRFKIGSRFERKFKDKHRHRVGFINSIGKDKPFLLLMACKFIYGTRIFSIFYVIKSGIKYSKFLLYDSISILIWASVMIPLGWLAGRGVSILLHIATRIEKALGIVLLSFILFYVIYRLISHWIIKREISNKN